mmetsp:Transcript_33224/g.83827  ORF Transcript_33224/g.83827 Transcript_33224/m.83827 type:complete len:295 (-) Transcript_33224:479-1363(-)
MLPASVSSSSSSSPTLAFRSLQVFSSTRQHISSSELDTSISPNNLSKPISPTSGSWSSALAPDGESCGPVGRCSASVPCSSSSHPWKSYASALCTAVSTAPSITSLKNTLSDRISPKYCPLLLVDLAAPICGPLPCLVIRPGGDVACFCGCLTLIPPENTTMTCDITSSRRTGNSVVCTRILDASLGLKNHMGSSCRFPCHAPENAASHIFPSVWGPNRMRSERPTTISSHSPVKSERNAADTCCTACGFSAFIVAFALLSSAMATLCGTQSQCSIVKTALRTTLPFPSKAGVA